MGEEGRRQPDPARPVPPGLSLRPVAGGQVPQGQVAGRRDRRQRAEHGVERDAASGDITALVFEDGERLAGDFFIDATGFRKRLIVKEMQAAWMSLCARAAGQPGPAVLAAISSRATKSPTTPAPGRRKRAGCGRSRRRSRFGCGYVYSDEFRTPDEAHAEVERVLGREDRCARRYRVPDRPAGEGLDQQCRRRRPELELSRAAGIDLDPRHDRADDDVCAASISATRRR